MSEVVQQMDGEPVKEYLSVCHVLLPPPPSVEHTFLINPCNFSRELAGR